jgi:tyrosyl-tRNA synthetase
MLDLASFRDGKVDLIGALVAAALVTNRSEGRRAIEQGGVLVDEEKVTDVHAVLDQEKLKNGGIVLRRGKKKFAKVAL